MSGNDDLHPDLERFYEALAADDEDGDFYLDEDDEDGDDYDLYLDAEDIDEEVDGVYDENGMLIEDVDIPDDDEDEDGEDDDEDEEGMIVEEDDEEENEAGTQWLNIAELLNSAGGSVQARSSLLARLLAGPGPAGGTRSGAGVRLTSMGSSEDRARQMAERRRKERWWKPQTEPHANGLKLLRSGEFGRVGSGARRRKGLCPPSRRDYIRTRAQVGYRNLLAGPLLTN